MHLFWDLLAQPWLALPQMALTVWMLVDAYRRGAEAIWFWIILLFQPLGAWIYLFAVKIRDFRLPGRRSSEPAAQRRLSIDELRYRVERSPTVVHRLALAERLMKRG